MTKHTPGPWIKDYNGTLGHVKAVNKLYPDGRGGFLTPTIAKYDLDFHWADNENAPVSKANQQANATLIAAAPDLLKALRDCQQVLFEYVYSDETPEMCSMAEAEANALDVIRRATK